MAVAKLQGRLSCPLLWPHDLVSSVDKRHAQRKEDGALHSGASLGALPYAYVNRQEYFTGQFTCRRAKLKQSRDVLHPFHREKLRTPSRTSFIAFRPC